MPPTVPRDQPLPMHPHPPGQVGSDPNIRLPLPLASQNINTRLPLRHTPQHNLPPPLSSFLPPFRHSCAGRNRAPSNRAASNRHSCAGRNRHSCAPPPSFLRRQEPSFLRRQEPSFLRRQEPRTPHPSFLRRQEPTPVIPAQAGTCAGRNRARTAAPPRRPTERPLSPPPLHPLPVIPAPPPPSFLRRQERAGRNRAPPIPAYAGMTEEVPRNDGEGARIPAYAGMTEEVPRNDGEGGRRFLRLRRNDGEGQQRRKPPHEVAIGSPSSASSEASSAAASTRATRS